MARLGLVPFTRQWTRGGVFGFRFQLPADACGSWRSLYAGVEKFADDLATHIRIENEILFPRFMES